MTIGPDDRLTPAFAVAGSRRSAGRDRAISAVHDGIPVADRADAPQPAA